MTFGDRLKMYREGKGYTQEELAEMIGVAKSTITGYEKGNRKPDVPKIKRLAKALGITGDDLLGTGIQTKITPLVSSEAMGIARDYDALDNWGKQAVRELVDTEKARCEDEARFLEETNEPDEPKVINLFDEGSAAGLALGQTGQGCQPYTLKPDDPQGAAYAIRVDGDSMEPDFPDGSIAFVNHDEMRDGDIGVFCVDGATVIKQWHYDKFMGITYLFSLNRKRADADLTFTPGNGRSLVWQGRVITKRQYNVPGL